MSPALIMAVLGLCAGASSAQFAGGDGSLGNPFQIATAEQLIGVIEQRVSISRDEGPESLQTKHFVLVADIDLDPNLPGGKVFNNALLNLSTGSLDGRGHKILNLHILLPARTTRWGNAGNIGPDAVVRNLSFERVFATGDSGILAFRNEGFVVNCSIEGISCGIGLVAENAGHVIGCSVTASPVGESGLVGTNSGFVLYSHVTGGLATSGGLVRGNTGTISDCYSTAAVCYSMAIVFRQGGLVFGQGGLVGTNTGTISRCYATGAVSGESTVGGLVGTNTGTISRCYATGHVSATSSSAGGLVADNSGTIMDCYARGAISAEGAKSNDAGGGLVELNIYPGTVWRCYATGAGGAGLIADSSLGGLVVSCYHLRPLDGGGSNNGLGDALTDLQMRRRESFIGWDFQGSSMDGTSEIWDMPEDGGYPILRVAQDSAHSGSGTAEDPYLIESADQLLAICRDVGAHYRLTADINLQGQSFSRPIIPIFWGHLDGNGHTLSNFTLTGADDNGFFGILHAETTVANLNLYGVHVVATERTPMWERTPMLIGVLAVHNYGKIVACSASADSAVHDDLGSNSYVSGLVAVNEGLGEISGCFVSWTATGWFSRAGHFCWGGIAGHNIGSVVECHASAFIHANYCGALVGQNDGVITDSYADGYSRKGGLVRTNRGEITNCYAATVVPLYPPTSYASPTGGLVGEASGGTITSSYFLAEAEGGGPDNGLGIVLSDTDMRRQASFSGWDFESVWMICEGRDYPRLRWEGVECSE